MSYTKAQVREGRALAKQGNESRFGLGDLALEVVPIGGDTSNTGGYAELEAFAAEIGVEFSALREYRRIAENWPHATRVASASWSVHREVWDHRDDSPINGKPHDWLRKFGERQKAKGKDRVTVDSVRLATDRKPTRYPSGGSGNGTTPPALSAGALVEQIRNNPDAIRALARHRDVVDEIENHVTEQRASQHDDNIKKWHDARNRIDGKLAKAFGTNNAVSALRTAAGAVGEAIFAAEEWGVEGFEDEESEAIKRIEHLLKVYKARTTITSDDEAFLASIGVQAP